MSVIQYILTFVAFGFDMMTTILPTLYACVSVKTNEILFFTMKFRKNRMSAYSHSVVGHSRIFSLVPTYLFRYEYTPKVKIFWFTQLRK